MYQLLKLKHRNIAIVFSCFDKVYERNKKAKYLKLRVSLDFAQFCPKFYTDQNWAYKVQRIALLGLLLNRQGKRQSVTESRHPVRLLLLVDIIVSV